MHSARPIIVSGFAPFGDRERNGAGEFARAIHEQFPETTFVEIPVLWGAPRQIVESYLPARPLLWLACGEAPGAFRIETRARNKRRLRPDNHGNIPARDMIEEAGPGEMRSLCPAAQITREVRGKGYPCRVSTNAGAYLCEEMLYILLRAQESLPEMEVLFLHVPHFGVDLDVNGIARPFRDELLHLAAWDFFTAISARP